jgi:ribosome-binding protein aMBF1 (putative translation factor)
MAFDRCSVLPSTSRERLATLATGEAEVDETFGDAVRSLRKQRGMSLRALARDGATSIPVT